jgi:hypothetical protein
MAFPILDDIDSYDRMYERADHDNRFSCSLVSKGATPLLVAKLEAQGITKDHILQVAQAYKCSNKFCNYVVIPADGDEKTRLYNIYKNHWSDTDGYPMLEFYDQAPQGDPLLAFHISAVKGGRVDKNGKPIDGSSEEVLRKQLLKTGFCLRSAADANRTRTVVRSYFGAIACNNCIGPASWRKYRNSKGNKYECPACLVNWDRSKGGTRWMKISNSCGISLILELDEPAHALLDSWKKERIEYYKRFEGVEPLRNKGVTLPADGDLTSILKLEGAASDAFWMALYMEDSVTSIKNVNVQFLHPEEDVEPKSA